MSCSRRFFLPVKVAFLHLSVSLHQGVAAEFVVSTTADLGPGSFRQAILDANNHPGADRIVFNIPGDGVQTIRPLSNLPAVADSVVLDGYTQPGAAVNTLAVGDNAVLKIQLDGGALPGTAGGMVLTGGVSTVRGLVFSGFPAFALWLYSSSNVVAGNFIGTDPSGLNPQGNRGDGITITPSCCQTIGGADPGDRNLISANIYHALVLGDTRYPPVTDTRILGNYIGTDRTGNRAFAGDYGPSMISIRSADNLVIGGLQPGEGNVIACDATLCLHLYTDLGTVRVQGNNFGVGVDGVSSLNTTNAAGGIEAHENCWVEGNRIAFFRVGLYGAVYRPGTALTLSRNLFFSNQLAAFRVSTTGLQVAPVVSSCELGTDLLAKGTVSGTPGATLHVEFFASFSRYTNGTGQADAYLGSAEVPVGPIGPTPFEMRLPAGAARISAWVTATATGPDGNTSLLSLPTLIRSSTFIQVHEQPSSVAVFPGSNATFRVDASGAPPLLHQWRKNGLDLPGATNTSLTVPSAGLSDRADYSVRIANPLGSVVSQLATLSLLIPPVFVQQPISQSVATGGYVTLSAQITNTAMLPLSFRWRSNGVYVSSTQSTQHASFFTFRPAQPMTSVLVVVTNQASLVTLNSRSATVTVLGDRDQDGIPDVWETLQGLDPDNPADAAEDPDHDGKVSLQEYFAGTNPHDPQSRLEFTRIALVGSRTELEFSAVSNHTYSIEYRSAGDAAGTAWQVLADVAARVSNHVAAVTDELGGNQRLYRVVTPRKP